MPCKVLSCDLLDWEHSIVQLGYWCMIRQDFTHLLFPCLEFSMEDSSYIRGLGGKAQSEDQTQVTSVQSNKYGDMGKYIIILFVF